MYLIYDLDKILGSNVQIKYIEWCKVSFYVCINIVLHELEDYV